MPAPIRFPTADEIPAELRVDASAYENRWLCDGEVRTWTGESMAIEAAVCVRNGDRVTRPVLGRVPALGEAEAMAALAAARRAYDLGRGAWPGATVAERLKAVETFLEKLKPLRAEVVKLLMWEIGKTKADAEKEFDRTVAYVRDTVSAVKELDRQSSRFVIEEGVIGQIRRSPLGVVLCMGPFNYPLNETWTTLIPALIMGNTIVGKLPRFGQLLHLPIHSAFAESFPPGVVNFVSGDGRHVSAPLMASGGVDVLAFIGSQRVGDLLKKSHPAPHRLRSVLGLGAKNTGIVLADADLDVAVREAVTGALSFNGQRCTALKLLLVERAVADEFTRRFADAVSMLKAGLPWEPGVKLTALPEDGKCDYLAGLVAEATAMGARVMNANGGEWTGTYFHPAVLYPCDMSMRVCLEEQFGPVVPIVPFDDEREAIDAVVASPFGQQAAIFGRDEKRVGRLVDALVPQVSRINLNSQCQRGPDAFPFTGRKASAEGTLSVTDALRVFSIRTLVAARDDAANRALVSSIVRDRTSSFVSTDFLF
jgi:glyceraldehyde-3-phosphate dehydrogenase (NADP+)